MITKIKKHGTITSYANGCRCEKCKKAVSDYRKNLKPKNHGTKWSYDIGCRCDKYKQAKKECYYCGEKIDGIGLDREDSKLGYNTKNVLPCCSKCNRAKGTLTKDNFITLCKKVSKRF